MTERKTDRPTRKAWKVTVALFPEEWHHLRQWADLRQISGGELVSSILSHWLVVNKAPDLPEPPADDEESAE